MSTVAHSTVASLLPASSLCLTGPCLLCLLAFLTALYFIFSGFGCRRLFPSGMGEFSDFTSIYLWWLTALIAKAEFREIKSLKLKAFIATDMKTLSEFSVYKRCLFASLGNWGPLVILLIAAQWVIVKSAHSAMRICFSLLLEDNSVWDKSSGNYTMD